MYNKKLPMFLLLCTVLLFALSACKTDQKEKDILTISGQKVQADAESWKTTSDIILKGRVIEAKEPYFSNPTNELLLEDGITPVENAYMFEYVIAIDQLYKGEWSEETITVKIPNRIGLTVDQALYGEDENTIVINEIPDVTLQSGECIIGLCYFDAGTYGGEPFYEPTYGAAGYFLPQGDGSYLNTATPPNHFSIDPHTLFTD